MSDKRGTTVFGEFFCDVCHAPFSARTMDDEAVCPSCGENILPEPEEQYVDRYDEAAH